MDKYRKQIVGLFFFLFIVSLTYLILTDTDFQNREAIRAEHLGYDESLAQAAGVTVNWHYFFDSSRLSTHIFKSIVTGAIGVVVLLFYYKMDSGKNKKEE